MLNRLARLKLGKHLTHGAATMAVWCGLAASFGTASAQVAMLSPDSSSNAAYFGYDVSFLEDMLLVTAPQSWDGRTGTVFGYRHDGASWNLVAEIKPGPDSNINWLGQTLEAAGKRIAVSANGTVHVFRHDNDTTWVEEFAELAGGSFVEAFSDRYLAIRRSGATDSMLVHMRSDTTWSHDDYIRREDLDEFAGGIIGGYRSSCFSGDQLFIADSGDNEVGADAGAVRVFARSSGRWEVTQKLLPPSGSTQKRLGHRIACSRSRFAVSTNDLNIFVYEFNEQAAWEHVQEFRLGGTTTAGYINDLAIDGKHLIVGDLYEQNRGAVWVYRDFGNGYEFVRRFETPRPPLSGDTDGEFGTVVALSGDFFVTGAPTRTLYHADGTPYNSGEAYVYGLADIEHVAREEQRGLQTEKRLDLYPNPGRGLQTIAFEVSTTESVSVTIYDVTGRLVQQIETSVLARGAHEVQLDTRSWSRGFYLVVMNAARSKPTVRRLVVL